MYCLDGATFVCPAGWTTASTRTGSYDDSVCTVPCPAGSYCDGSSKLSAAGGD